MNKVSWLLITASAFTGAMLSQMPLCAQQTDVNPNAKEKVKFYNAPRQMQISDERPIIRDFREAPSTLNKGPEKIHTIDEREHKIHKHQTKKYVGDFDSTLHKERDVSNKLKKAGHPHPEIEKSKDNQKNKQLGCLISTFNHNFFYTSGWT